MKPEDDPVELIRKTYKSTAVETDLQIKYIEMMTGRYLEACGSDNFATVFTPTIGNVGQSNLTSANVTISAETKV